MRSHTHTQIDHREPSSSLFFFFITSFIHNSAYPPHIAAPSYRLKTFLFFFLSCEEKQRYCRATLLSSLFHCVRKLFHLIECVMFLGKLNISCLHLFLLEISFSVEFTVLFQPFLFGNTVVTLYVCVYARTCMYICVSRCVC